MLFRSGRAPAGSGTVEPVSYSVNKKAPVTENEATKEGDHWADVNGSRENRVGERTEDKVRNSDEAER